MSKPSLLAAFLTAFFGRSEKAISEKLSTEEHNEFVADVTALNEKLTEATGENTKLTGDLEAANARVAELEASLSASETKVTAHEATISTLTTDRDKYKAHYDKSASKGDKEGDDQNSRGASGKAGYNENALAVWQKANS